MPQEIYNLEKPSAQETNTNEYFVNGVPKLINFGPTHNRY